MYLNATAHAPQVGFYQIQAQAAAGVLRVEPLVKLENVLGLHPLQVNAQAIIGEGYRFLPIVPPVAVNSTRSGRWSARYLMALDRRLKKML